MAGDWIPAQVDLPRKREVLMIARQTKRSRHEVVGLLIEFWAWASNETSDGTLVGVHVEDLDTIIGADQSFWKSVVSCGWLIDNDNSISIPKADQWITKGAKARLQKNKDQANWRRKQNTDGNVEDDVEKSSSTKTSTTEEKRREEKKKEKHMRPNGRDAALDDSKKKPRQRNLLFDAVCEVTASDPKVSASHVQKVCKALQSAEPPYTPEEVHLWAEMVASEGWMVGTPSLGFLQQSIGKIRQQRPPPVDDFEASVKPLSDEQRAFLANMFEEQRREHERQGNAATNAATDSRPIANCGG